MSPRMLALAVMTGTTLLGCGSKALDAKVDHLIRVLQQGDYAAFESLSDPSLVAKYPLPRFQALSQAVQAQGAFESRKLRGIKSGNGEPYYGRYVLTFARLTVRLTVRLKRGRFTDLSFENLPIRSQ
jgi:hypothetical protein